MPPSSAWTPPCAARPDKAFRDAGGRRHTTHDKPHAPAPASASTTMPRCRRSAVSACGSRRCRPPPSISRPGWGLMDPELLSLLVTRTMPFGRVPGPADRRPARAYLAWFARKGFPPGELGRLLALMHELDHNGLASCWRRCARRALARWARAGVKRAGQGRAGRALRRRCRANVTKCARTVLQSATSYSGWVQAGQIRVQAKRVQAPNRVQAPKRSRHHVFPQARTTTWNFRPMSR